MASIINASSSGSGGIVQTADASGVLQLQSNGTVALTTSGANVTIANQLTLTTGLTINAATSSLYNTDGTLSRYSTSNGVYLNGNSAGWLALQGDGTQATTLLLYGATEASLPNTITIKTNSLERMRISSAGYVTQPYQPMFSTSRTGGSVTGTAPSATVIVFDNNMVNVSSSYNNTNGRFTAPVAGTYYFSAMGMLDTSSVASADTQMIMTVNGSTVSDSNPPMSGTATPQGMGFAASFLYTLAVGDYVDVRFYSSSNSNKFYGAGGRFNNFSGFLIG